MPPEKPEYEPVLDYQHRKELKTRYEYLKHGGEWQRQVDHATQDRYVAGFEDAMKVLGVLP